MSENKELSSIKDEDLASIKENIVSTEVKKRVQDTNQYRNIRRAERIFAASRNKELDEFIVAGTKYKGRNPSFSVVRGITIKNPGIPFIKLGAVT